MIGSRTRMITIKSDDEIRIMRVAGRHVAEVVQILVEAIEPGMATKELDKIVRREYGRRGLVATFLGYASPPYPATVCVSINEQLVHGIPGNQVIREGDLVTIDLGATYKGFVADHAVTMCVPPVTPEKQRLMDVTRESLTRGIAVARAGIRLGVISSTIGDYIESQGYGVVRKYCGHGVGRQMHEEPNVPNYGSPNMGPMLRKGMALALEPMVTIGDYETRVLGDKWTVVTVDGSLCAHFEHTIAITEDGADILTVP
ncbi:MAG TPA: type I methionyl aminopeptidase [Dehalococcoidia bacterium]